MAKSTGTTSLSSPIATMSKTPSIPESARCSCPLYQVPTNPNCPRTRHRSKWVRHPNSEGYIIPTILPNSCCWLLKRPADLGHEVFRQPQVIEGLVEGLSGVLRLAAVSRETLMYFKATTFAGFDMFFGVSFARGHGCSLGP